MANLDQNKIIEDIKNDILQANEIDSNVEYTKKIISILSRLHRSDAHAIASNMINIKSMRFQSCKNDSVETYQELQNILLEAKKSYDHDRKMATNLDVDKAVSKAYGILTRLIRANMDMEQNRFNEVTKAINKIEEHLGLDVTDFKENDGDDNSESVDVQGNKKSAE